MLDVATFRQAMGLFPGAVTLITTGEGDLRRGITATAVCSVTDSPPSLLVCVNRKTGTCSEIQRSGWFSVQLLGADQADLALCFAGATGATGIGKFATPDWTTCPAGQPRLKAALASLSCRVTSASENGSHMVFIGAIEDAALRDGEALIYAQSSFRRLEPV
ncbi:4-hydroxyphenylacetate 3-monooxygenase [Celeribacter ethanolicus]|uniref:4-hydroxyphenylacetate 3-monooxygenase n=1 Tax=Celeribacter ethanolicus TaxID=1758178 RepID=A0A291G9R6_9RHOB|nr:flavin reductase family protein [Celeribacter ethanolicus]ATG46804.1 4-hydroxyphenylacetate 3-monooxygenase [Celeribacter ethanolicus]